MKKNAFFCLLLFFGVSQGADDLADPMVACQSLGAPGEQQCMAIIARYKYAPMHTMRTLTRAEKTAFSAVLNSDPKAFLVILPDGSVELGQPQTERAIGIPCMSLASCK